MKYIIRFSTLSIFWSDWIRSVKMNQNGSNWIKMDQNGSNLIKLDFWWNNHWNISSDFQLYSFFDQNILDLSKMDQNGSNLIKFEIYHQIFKFIYFLIRLNQIFPKWIKMDQTRSIWWNNHWNYHVLLFCIVYYLFNIFNLFNQLYVLVF